MKRLFAILLLFCASSAQAATITAASCSQADVQTAINSALVDGDIVQIPAGNCPWTGTITVALNRSITIQGAGAISATNGGSSTTGTDVTTILDHHPTSGHTLFQFDVASGKRLRITGIRFLMDGTSVATQAGVIHITGGSNSARIDHNHFVSNPDGTMSIGVFGSGTGLTGVIDHNYFDSEVGNGPFAVFLQNGVDPGDAAWSAPDDWGTDKFLFMEDNRWRNGYLGDAATGGQRFAYRHNTGVFEGQDGPAFQGGYVANHGITSGRSRSSRAFEYYGNVFSAVAPGLNKSPFPINGGTGLVWGNTISQYRYVTSLNYTRKDNATYPYGSPPTGWGNCTGTSGTVWDGPGGYPCLDQPGRGQGDLLSGYPIANTVNTRTGTQSYVVQALSPIYVWANILDPAGYSGTPIVNFDSALIQANRDFYQQFGANGEPGSFNGTHGVGQGLLSARPANCTSGAGYWATDTNRLYVCNPINNWTLYYTPYTYPHPIAGGTPIPTPTATATVPPTPTPTPTPTPPGTSAGIVEAQNGANRVSSVDWINADSGSLAFPAPVAQGNFLPVAGAVRKTIAPTSIVVRDTMGSSYPGATPGQYKVTMGRVLTKPGPTPATGLIAAYSFDEGSGTTTIDNSGSGHTGTLVNGTAWAAGVFGSSLSFDGINDYVSLATPGTLNFGTSNFTISAWVKRQVTGAEHNIMSKTAISTWETGGKEFFISASDNTLAFGSFGFGDVHSTGTIINDGFWHYATVTFVDSSNTISLYIDGVLSGTGTLNLPVDDGTHVVKIGSNPAGAYFRGTIDEVRIYNRALSGAEITADMGSSIVDPGGEYRTFIARAFAASSGPNTVTVDPQGTGAYFSWSQDEFAGVDPVIGLTDGTDVQGTMTASTAGTATNDHLGANLIIAAMSHNNTSVALSPGVLHTEFGKNENNATCQAHAALFKLDYLRLFVPQRVDYAAGAAVDREWTVQTYGFGQAPTEYTPLADPVTSKSANPRFFHAHWP